MEFRNLQNFEQDGDHSSFPEQLVIDEKESSENTELVGGEEPSMHEGSEIAPNELIGFGSNLVRANQFSGERNGEKDVLASLALMGEMIANQRMAKRGKSENSKLIVEGQF